MLADRAYENQVYRGYHQHELAVFDRFRPAPVPAEPGFVTDFLNIRVRIALLWEDVRGLDGQRIDLPIPGDYRAEAIEWLGLLRSVTDARDEYVAMELGAGFGPWLVSGAAAAQHIGIESVRLYGVEADPDHFAFMRQHFRDNGIDPDAHTLLNAAAGARAGTALWPRVAHPFNEWAARPARESNATDASYNGRRLERCMEIPVLPVTDLLEREPRWDLVHIDLQGWEGEICAVAADVMDRRVRRLVVGLHSRRLEGEMLDLFYSRGWVLENEKPSRFVYNSCAPTIENMTVLDGVQVWRNPRPGRKQRALRG
jgi:FkbM family methyltransferase